MGRVLSVNVSPVTDAHHQDREPLILDVANEPVIPQAVFPEPACLRSPQRLAEAARVFEHGYAVSQKPKDPASGFPVEFRKFLFRLGVEFNPPAQGDALLP